MKIHTLRWKKNSEYCDLCNEYHRYTHCPRCGNEIEELGLSDNYLCQCRQLFSIWKTWEGDDTTQEFVECEWLETKRPRRGVSVFCGHKDGYSCIRNECPLLREKGS